MAPAGAGKQKEGDDGERQYSLEKTRNNRITAHIPVIAMTANVMKKDRENVFQAGCDGYISKPIDIDELPAQIESFLKGKL